MTPLLDSAAIDFSGQRSVHYGSGGLIGSDRTKQDQCGV